MRLTLSASVWPTLWSRAGTTSPSSELDATEPAQFRRS
jgi:hypothetical protein